MSKIVRSIRKDTSKGKIVSCFRQCLLSIVKISGEIRKVQENKKV